MVMLSPRHLTVPAGQTLLLRDVSWQDFEDILGELGEGNVSELKLYSLQEGRYTEVDSSLVFPQLPIQELPALIERHRYEGRRALRRATRAWVRGAISSQASVGIA